MNVNEISERYQTLFEFLYSVKGMEFSHIRMSPDTWKAMFINDPPFMPPSPEFTVDFQPLGMVVMQMEPDIVDGKILMRGKESTVVYDPETEKFYDVPHPKLTFSEMKRLNEMMAPPRQQNIPFDGPNPFVAQYEPPPGVAKEGWLYSSWHVRSNPTGDPLMAKVCYESQEATVVLIPQIHVAYASHIVQLHNQHVMKEAGL